MCSYQRDLEKDHQAALQDHHLHQNVSQLLPNVIEGGEGGRGGRGGREGETVHEGWGRNREG